MVSGTSRPLQPNCDAGIARVLRSRAYYIARKKARDTGGCLVLFTLGIAVSVTEIHRLVSVVNMIGLPSLGFNSPLVLERKTFIGAITFTNKGRRLPHANSSVKVNFSYLLMTFFIAHFKIYQCFKSICCQHYKLYVFHYSIF